ncbi:MAG: dTDP-4-dehydrorhamnose 3,5-epimerase [Spirochaetes bacterium]|uniref:dTDP-4-dehydrorhamnose 3,5-epimerase n=1 Tax=Candidatus Avitreponema avistercoris TaxID=2840705 RepID=A0A9D9EQC4_9SPIR|nr:dTDP-4-dehydrorhamnose 3,5-epimerase [Candidatus Avitreponema avistercoris]
MAFTFTPCVAADGTVFPGLQLIQPRLFPDNRGLFFESYNERDFAAAGLDVRFVQDNQSASSQNVLRGLHFQSRHPQGKLVRVISGRVYDVAVDLRRGSPAFGRPFGVVLDGETCGQFYIPPGFAHGFFVLSASAVFAYKCTDFYHPEDEQGLMWNDPLLAVDWASAAGGEFSPLLSEKDGAYPPFDPAGKYFRLDGTWEGA